VVTWRQASAVLSLPAAIDTDLHRLRVALEKLLAPLPCPGWVALLKCAIGSASAFSGGVQVTAPSGMP